MTREHDQAAGDGFGHEQIADLIDLLQGSDTCEVKLTIPDSAIGSTSRSLGFDVLDAEIREVVFFDTPNLDLHERGVILRARRKKKGRGDAVFKMRPVTPSGLPTETRRSKNVGVEVDIMPGRFVASASMKADSSAAAIRKVILGHDEAETLFSKGQRAAFNEFAPEGIGINDLAMMGPITIFKLESLPAGFENEVVAEIWAYPDGSRNFELSTKCLPHEAFEVSTQWRSNLKKHGVELEGEQQTKTSVALEYFSGLLKE